MATFIVSFDSEQEAQDAIRRLTNSNLGTVRARVLDSSDPTTDTDDMHAPMITQMGTVDVRPSDSPSVPEARTDDLSEDASGVVPTTGSEPEGVQVLIEMDEDNQEEVLKILKRDSGSSKK